MARHPDFETEMGRLEREIGYSFGSRRDLLREALTSGAYAANHPDGPMRHHGRLAFLGDAVLYLIVTEDLLRHALPSAPGSRVAQKDLTGDRQAQVNNTHLAYLGRELGIVLPTRVGQSSDNGLGEETQMATTMEALFGAIYEDTGRDLDRTADLILPILARARPKAPP